MIDLTRKHELEAQLFDVRLTRRHLCTRLRNRKRTKEEIIALELQLQHLRRKEKVLWNTLTGLGHIPAELSNRQGAVTESHAEGQCAEICKSLSYLYLPT